MKCFMVYVEILTDNFKRYLNNKLLISVQILKSCYTRITFLEFCKLLLVKNTYIVTTRDTLNNWENMI